MIDTFKTYLWVMLGSALGGASRFWVSGLITSKLGKLFPWDIMIINITGSFLIGLFSALSSANGSLTSNQRWLTLHFLMIGVCGGYTTFSSFSLNTLRLAQDGEWLYVFGNITGSILFCLVAVWLGYMLGQTLNR